MVTVNNTRSQRKWAVCKWLLLLRAYTPVVWLYLDIANSFTLGPLEHSSNSDQWCVRLQQTVNSKNKSPAGCKRNQQLIIIHSTVPQKLTKECCVSVSAGCTTDDLFSVYLNMCTVNRCTSYKAHTHTQVHDQHASLFFSSFFALASIPMDVKNPSSHQSMCSNNCHYMPSKPERLNLKALQSSAYAVEMGFSPWKQCIRCEMMLKLALSAGLGK